MGKQVKDDKSWLKKALKASSDRALRENRALNISTLVARKGKLIRINCDGKEQEIGEAHKPVKVDKKKFHFPQ